MLVKVASLADVDGRIYVPSEPRMIIKEGCVLCIPCVSIYSLFSLINYFSTVQYSTVQYSTVQYSTVQYSTVQ